MSPQDNLDPIDAPTQVVSIPPDQATKTAIYPTPRRQDRISISLTDQSPEATAFLPDKSIARLSIALYFQHQRIFDSLDTTLILILKPSWKPFVREE